MNSADKKTLEKLIANNSMSQILKSLSDLALIKAGEYSDLQLNNNAKEWCRNSVFLQELSNIING